jgi:hypothetical protein
MRVVQDADSSILLWADKMCVKIEVVTFQYINSWCHWIRHRQLSSEIWVLLVDQCMTEGLIIDEVSRSHHSSIVALTSGRPFLLFCSCSRWIRGVRGIPVLCSSNKDTLFSLPQKFVARICSTLLGTTVQKSLTSSSSCLRRLATSWLLLFDDEDAIVLSIIKVVSNRASRSRSLR